MVNLCPVVAGRERTFCCHSAVLSGKFVPNSLAAVDECVRFNVPRIEVDVRFLSDDTMIVYHGSQLDEDTTGTGKVSDHHRSSARAIHYLDDLSSTLCSLEEVVDLLRPVDTTLQIDLKLMRPIGETRLRGLTAALSPLADRVLVGSQAHWNLRQLALAGVRVAFDPTMQWHFSPERGLGYFPDTMGVYGMWDDAPVAHNRNFSPRQYFETRTQDILGLLPAAVEWMVDIGTIRHMANLGFSLGDELAERDVELAAWTLRDVGPEQTLKQLMDVCGAGAATIITADPSTVLAYLGSGPL
ncbi:MAG: glycerophosphodiester phosphodiesterase family protein [Anaerolineaceae bacterium]